MTQTPPYRGRFAPSPTGPLHFGSLVAALGSWMMARRAGGTWIVRMEDIDRPREVPGAAQRQLDTLAAFGMPSDAPVLRQSERGERYQAALTRLLETGDAFPCRCSRSELEAVGGIHRQCLGPGDPARVPAIRLRVPVVKIAFDDALQGHYQQDLATDVGDFVLRRADGCWAYQLAVVVDDAEQGITDVVRGADLLDSTPRQILLQQRLGLPSPNYAHLPLVRDAEGRKLGKSLQSLPIDDDAPWPALRAAWRFLGQSAEALDGVGAPATALLRAATRFDPARIPATTDHPVSAPDDAT
ncbi:tRNA glutamyl-Q(34) synthetase GluQRS [Arenimonas alkanexedens]